MGKSSGNSAQQAAQTASMQGAWNSFTAQQQQQMNMIDQSTPWGDLRYEQVGSTTMVGPDGRRVTVPRYKATQSLSDSQREIFDAQQNAQKNLGQIASDQSQWLKGYLGSQFNIDGAPNATDYSSMSGPEFERTGGGPDLQTQLGEAGDITRTYGTDYAANVQEVQDALMSRMQPQLQQDEARLREQLINSGLRPGTAAYNSEMDRLSRSQNDARMTAVLAGGQEQSRLAGLAQGQAQFQNQAQQQAYDQLLGSGTFNNAALQQMYQNQAGATAANNANAQQGFQNQMGLAGAQDQARQNYINEQTMLRNQPLNELIGLMSGTQVQNPNATYAQTPQTQVGGVDYAGIYNNISQQNTAQNNAMMGGLFGLGSAAIKLSDARAKEDIRRVGTTECGLPIYIYRYKGSDVHEMGVMAQEAREMFPEAVGEFGNGMLGVDYARIS